MRVHDHRLIHALQEECKNGPGLIDYAPTYVTSTSYEDALRAAGGVMACTRAVLHGDAKNAFAIVRPPGHHAEPDRAMGFCIFNNIAVAARDALAHGLERVMIIDFDAHHGNGTQAAFLSDERVGFISTHQWGIYPGTGWYTDAPHARKRLVNVPLQAYAGDETLIRVSEQIFQPVVELFHPEVLLVSAGFDAHWNDPLTSLGVSTRGFFNLSRRLVQIADEYCGGKVVFVLEGGYDPRNLAHGVDAVFDALTHHPLRSEAHDPSPHNEPNPESRIAEIRAWHHLF